MSPPTIFLSRLLGLYCILVGLSMVTHKQTTVETMEALVRNPPALFIVGVIALAAGLAIILGHNIWSGGALQVVVTLVGWMSLIKGLFYLFLPPEAAVGLLIGGFHYEQLFYMYTAITLALGVYLTYGGFRSSSH